MKKSVRLLAMLLCVLTIATLVPTTVFAADVDEVMPAVNKVASVIRTKQASLQANGNSATYTKSTKVGKTVTMKDPLYGTWGKPGYPKVKYQWYFRKKGATQYSKISGATKYYYRFKATLGKNGSVYRLKITNRANSKDYAYVAFKIKVSR